MLNVIKGWPNGHASELSTVKPDAAAAILEGMAVVLEDDGAGVPQWTIADGASITDVEDAFGLGWALDTNTTFGRDVRFSNKLPVVQHNFTAVTDQFVAAAFVPGSILEIGTAANIGKLQLLAAGVPVAVVVSYDSVDGKLTFYRP